MYKNNFLLFSKVNSEKQKIEINKYRLKISEVRKIKYGKEHFFPLNTLHFSFSNIFIHFPLFYEKDKIFSLSVK
jgi:hypothetical protein